MSAVMSYKYPPLQSETPANFTQWTTATPVNGSVYRSDQNNSILINVASQSGFLSTVQSMLLGTITAYGADNNPITNAVNSSNSYGGMSRVFSKMIIRANGVPIEEISNYNDLLSLYYSTCSASKKSLLKSCEGYSNTAMFGTVGRFNWAHLIVSSLFVTPQLLPLPLLEGGGGLQLEFILADKSSLFTTNAVAYYSLSDIRFQYLSVFPSPAYVVSLKAAVRSGRAAVIPFQKIHVFRSPGQGSNTLIANIALGQVTSLVDITSVFWSETTFADITQDKAKRFIDPGVLDWRITGADCNFPSQTAFRSGTSPETVLMSLATQCGNVYDMHQGISLDADYATNSFRLSINFSSDGENWASGLNTLGGSSPFLTLTANCSSAVPNNCNMMTFATVDAILRFQGTEISVSEIL